MTFATYARGHSQKRTVFRLAASEVRRVAEIEAAGKSVATDSVVVVVEELSADQMDDQSLLDYVARVGGDRYLVCELHGFTLPANGRPKAPRGLHASMCPECRREEDERRAYEPERKSLQAPREAVLAQHVGSTQVLDALGKWYDRRDDRELRSGSIEEAVALAQMDQAREDDMRPKRRRRTVRQYEVPAFREN